jgi:psiF repeat-containing protein
MTYPSSIQEGSMRGLVGALVAVALAGSVAAASDGKKEEAGERMTQGERMRVCSQAAATKGLKGDERKEFMSHCLRGEKTGGASRSGS